MLSPKRPHYSGASGSKKPWVASDRGREKTLGGLRRPRAAWDPGNDLIACAQDLGHRVVRLVVPIPGFRIGLH